MFALHFANIIAKEEEPNPVAAGIFILLCCGVFGIPLLSVWMAKDAKSRGMDPGLWVILAWLTGPIGLAIYLFSRSQGVLIACPNCGNNRMEASVRCPHCWSEEKPRPPK
jgi:hypothetical protein